MKSIARNLIVLCSLAGLCLSVLALPVPVGVFKNDLSVWTGKSACGGAHSGVIVVDPLGASNHVLTFTAQESAGAIFTADTATSPKGACTVTFDYLGLAKPGSVACDFSGYFGLSLDRPGAPTRLPDRFLPNTH